MAPAATAPALPALSAPLRAAAPGLAVRLAMILAGLAALIARAYLRHPTRAALILPLWKRLTRAARRFTALAARLAAGRPAKPSKPGRPGTRPTPFPTRHGWLVHDLRHEAAHFTAQLEALLAEPLAAELLANSPAAARILRPLCHMLGVTKAAIPPTTPKQPPARPIPPAPTAALRPEAAPLAPPPCPHLRWPWRSRA